MAKSDLAGTALQVGDVDFVDTRLFGKVDLPPASFLSKLPNSFAKLDANVRRHSFSIDLAQALYLVDALFRGARIDVDVQPPSLGLTWLSREKYEGRGRTSDEVNNFKKPLDQGENAAIHFGLFEETINDDSL